MLSKMPSSGMIIDKLGLEGKRVISPRDMQMMKKKYDFWKTMHPNTYRCKHCIYYDYSCTSARIRFNLGDCLAFLYEGNYVK